MDEKKVQNYETTGVVSFGLIWEYVWQQEAFLSRLKYLIETVPDEECGEGVLFLHELTDTAREAFDIFAEKAKLETDKFGGNHVHVVKEVGHG